MIRMMKANRRMFTGIAALGVAAAAFVTVTSGANTPGCNNEGDTCFYLFNSSANQIELYGSGTGDKRNVRTWVNGNYQGQFESNAYTWFFSPGHNVAFQAAVQSCWNGTFSSTCHSWATAESNPTITPPNQRFFTNGVLHNHGKCLDLYAFNTANGSPVVIWDCDGKQNQLWTMQSDGSIHSAVNTNKCLDLPNANTANGTLLQIWDCNGTGAQKWSYENNNEFTGYYGKCLDLPSGNTTNGTRLQYYDCFDNANQTWSL